MADTLKICVVGPCKVGKTLLCRALAEQPVFPGEYHPTAAVRIQEVSRTVGVDRIKLQLWDCSGSPQYQTYWPVLSKDLDGVILVLDAQHPEHERELEQFYINFAQTNSLTVKQCLVVAVQVAKEGAYGLGGWSGLQGKLSKLPQVFVSVNPSSPQAGIQDMFGPLGTVLSVCLAKKKAALEKVVAGDPEEHEEREAALL